jgi:hypothetical protein
MGHKCFREILSFLPYLLASMIVCLVSGRGGSKKVSRPIIFHSPFNPSIFATAKERMPISPNLTTDASTCSLTSLSEAFNKPKMMCGAPLVVLSSAPVLVLRRVPSVRLNLGSNGTNSERNEKKTVRLRHCAMQKPTKGRMNDVVFSASSQLACLFVIHE